MRKKRGIILLALIIFPSLFLIFHTSNSTNLTTLNEENENDYNQNEAPLTGDDSFEDNDFFGQAKYINKGWYSLMCEDEDWFKIGLEEGEEIGVEIQFVQMKTN